jgi:hypothetical protein
VEAELDAPKDESLKTLARARSTVLGVVPVGIFTKALRISSNVGGIDVMIGRSP